MFWIVLLSAFVPQLGGEAIEPPLTPEVEIWHLDAIAAQVEEQRERELQELLEAQERLRELGWYEGGVDGIHGPLTQAAVEDFAAEVDKEPEVEVLLVVLRRDDAPKPPPPPPPPAPTPAPAPESAPSAPAPSTSANGIPSHWMRLAECESGNWVNGGASFEPGSARWDWAKPGTSVPPWGTTIHHGGLQFHPGTWSAFASQAGLGHIAYAYNATPQEQVRVAELVQQAQGWGAWPTCSRKVGLR